MKTTGDKASHGCGGHGNGGGIERVKMESE